MSLNDFEILIVEPDMSLCHYGGGGWSDAWRSGWESAVAACNLELMRRLYSKSNLASEQEATNSRQD